MNKSLFLPDIHCYIRTRMISALNSLILLGFFSELISLTKTDFSLSERTQRHTFQPLPTVQFECRDRVHIIIQIMVIFFATIEHELWIIITKFRRGFRLYFKFNYAVINFSPRFLDFILEMLYILEK